MKCLRQLIHHPPTPERGPREFVTRFLVGLGVSLVLTATPGAAEEKIVPESVTWELTKTVVVNPGTTTVTAEGQLLEGYTIESTAKEKDSKLVPEGTFRLKLSVFQPSVDMDGQDADRWYIEGKWQVIDKYALDDEKHSRGVVSGFINTSLDFDPTQTPAGWTALTQLPMSTVTAVSVDGIQWGRGSGTYTVDGAFEGTLYVDLALWPVVQVE